jgi:hypothetical protein
MPGKKRMPVLVKAVPGAFTGIRHPAPDIRLQ